LFIVVIKEGCYGKGTIIKQRVLEIGDGLTQILINLHAIIMFGVRRDRLFAVENAGISERGGKRIRLGEAPLTAL
jgi:hypothetical protein